MSVDNDRQLKALDVGNSLTVIAKLVKNEDVSVALLLKITLKAVFIVAVGRGLDVEITGLLVPLDLDIALLLGRL